jgi:hypothetical protein
MKRSASSVCSRRSSVVRLMSSSRAVRDMFATASPSAMRRNRRVARCTGGER